VLGSSDVGSLVGDVNSCLADFMLHALTEWLDWLTNSMGQSTGVTWGGAKSPPPQQYFFNLRNFLVTELNNGK
jgi:hypothetical protein